METLTLTQIAEKFGRPESTIRGYRDRFIEYIPITGRGRSRRYPTEAAVVFEVIIRLKDAGYNDAQVVERLQQKYTKTIEVKTQVQKDMHDTIIEMQRNQAKLMQQFELMKDEIESLKKAAAANIAFIRQTNDTLTENEKRLNALENLTNELKTWQREKERQRWWQFWKKKDFL